MVSEGVAGILFYCPLVGILCPGEVTRIEINVSQTEVDRRFLDPVLQSLDEKVDPLLVPLRPAEFLGPCERGPADPPPFFQGQCFRFRERRYESLSFTAFISSHVRYLGLPFFLLGFRRRKLGWNMGKTSIPPFQV